MGTIQQADPKARRIAIQVICVATVLGLITILMFENFQDDFQTWLEKNIDFLLENTIVVFAAGLVSVSPLLAAGAYLLLIGNRTINAQRFPPPGCAVARDTPVLEGRKGIQRGRIIQVLSLFLLCCAGAIPVVLWLIFRSLGSVN
jgi:hypothetical protein